MAFSRASDVPLALYSGLPVAERSGPHGQFVSFAPRRNELIAFLRSNAVYNAEGSFFGWAAPDEAVPSPPALLIRDFEVRASLVVHRGGQTPVDDSKYLLSGLEVIDHRKHTYNPREFRNRIRNEVPSRFGQVLGCSLVPSFQRDVYTSDIDRREQRRHPESGASLHSQSAVLLSIFQEVSGEPQKVVDMSFSPPRETKRCDISQLVVAAMEPVFDMLPAPPSSGIYLAVSGGTAYARAG